MAEWIKDGGVFAWVLAGMSVVSVAFILERAWALRRARVMPPSLASMVGSADASTLRGACQAQPSPLARLVTAILDHLGEPKDDNMASLQVQARREVLGLERGLVALEIIVGIAPLLGLVGTVYGIIPLFGDFGKAVSGDNTLIAKGIDDAKKNLVIFVTPTIIDPAGKRVHTPENFPVDPNSIPAQSAAK